MANYVVYYKVYYKALGVMRETLVPRYELIGTVNKLKAGGAQVGRIARVS